MLPWAFNFVQVVLFRWICASPFELCWNQPSYWVPVCRKHSRASSDTLFEDSTSTQPESESLNFCSGVWQILISWFLIDHHSSTQTTVLPAYWRLNTHPLMFSSAVKQLAIASHHVASPYRIAGNFVGGGGGLLFVIFVTALTVMKFTPHENLPL